MHLGTVKTYLPISFLGNGYMETESDINNAFENKKRIHQETGIELLVISTSCKMINFQTFREELHSNNFVIIED